MFKNTALAGTYLLIAFLLDTLWCWREDGGYAPGSRVRYSEDIVSHVPLPRNDDSDDTDDSGPSGQGGIARLNAPVLTQRISTSEDRRGAGS